jgi:hypothetical protein
MNLQTALTVSLELKDDPRKCAGDLLAGQRQVTDIIREILESEDAWVLQFDIDDWKREVLDLAEAVALMSKRCG